MKRIIFLFSFFALVSFTFAQNNSHIRYQSGYYKPSIGRFVQPHYKTNINNTNHDNFSTKGNINNFTGQSGYRARNYSIDVYNYGSNKTIYNGLRGGQYYYNNFGNRIYVPRR